MQLGYVMKASEKSRTCSRKTMYDDCNMIEIELLNGNRVLLVKDWDKIYKLCEKTKRSLKLKSSFPFFKIERKRYVQFKLRTVYEYVDSIADPTYKVNCTLQQLARMFGQSITPFEVSVVKSDLYA